MKSQSMTTVRRRKATLRGHYPCFTMFPCKNPHKKANSLTNKIILIQTKYECLTMYTPFAERMKTSSFAQSFSQSESILVDNGWQL